jgi:hypothetical protein
VEIHFLELGTLLPQFLGLKAGGLLLRGDFVLSSMLYFSQRSLGRLMSDRVIDAPAHRVRTDLDQPISQGRPFLSLPSVVSRALLPCGNRLLALDLKGADYLLLAKLVSSTSYLGIRHDPARYPTCFQKLVSFAGRR